jgi:CubicO group peptidase (beta-lactamase class C family)
MASPLLPFLYLALACATSLPLNAIADTPQLPAAERQVDALFAKWNTSNTPGAAVEIRQDGKPILRKTYGMADLERAVPITGNTVFNIGSMTKQFTAHAIHSLARDGKLALEDDVRKHLPEFPDVGATITLRHLLQHTSGLRDILNLMLLAGWRQDDVMTYDDMIGLLARQRALNFQPGAESVYSNTNYLLLAMVVQRVSGQPLSAYLRQHVFVPLGMHDTVVPDDYGMLVPRRALSYVPKPGGYRYLAVSATVAGANGIHTTLDDLARWDRNFLDPQVGGPELIAAMQSTGLLSDGKPNKFASGLVVDRYRGQRVVEHSGGVGGFRSQLYRFPDQRFSITILANAADIGVTAMARKIADIYLDAHLQPKTPAAATAAGEETGARAVTSAPTPIGALLGYYALTPDFGFTMQAEGDQLAMHGIGQDKIVLQANGDRSFRLEGAGLTVRFDPPGADGKSPRVILRQGGKDEMAVRSTYPGIPGNNWADFTGSFFSKDLQATYTILRKDGKLLLSYSRGTLPLGFTGNASFSAGFPIGDLRFACTKRGACRSFTVNSERIRGVQFERITAR